MSESSSSAYGPLLDVSDSNENADLVVDRWINQGACAALFYVAGLLGLAWATQRRIHNRKLTYAWECVFSLVCTVCKLMVGLCASKVHHYLSPTSHEVAGGWVLVLAWCKYLAAASHFLLFLLFAASTVGLWEVEGMVCILMYIFIVSFVLVLIFQSGAALALLRINARASDYIGDANVFSEIVGSWWLGLVCGTFGVGASIWLAGATIVFDDIADDTKPEVLCAVFNLIAVVCQLLAGTSVVCINRRVRSYFKARSAAAAAAVLPGQVMEMSNSVSAPPVAFGRDSEEEISSNAVTLS